MRIGKVLIKLRKKHNLSQIELARKMNISRQAISKWERDETMPDIARLIDLAKLFDTSVDYILGLEKD